MKFLVDAFEPSRRTLVTDHGLWVSVEADVVRYIGLDVVDDVADQARGKGDDRDDDGNCRPVDAARRGKLFAQVADGSTDAGYLGME